MGWLCIKTECLFWYVFLLALRNMCVKLENCAIKYIVLPLTNSNNGSDSGLVPSGNKALPEPMLTLIHMASLDHNDFKICDDMMSYPCFSFSVSCTFLSKPNRRDQYIHFTHVSIIHTRTQNSIQYVMLYHDALWHESVSSITVPSRGEFIRWIPYRTGQ